MIKSLTLYAALCGILAQGSDVLDNIVETVYIKVGAPAYDSIYYKTLPNNITKKWIFVTDDHGKISFSCKEMTISYRALCRKEELIVDNGEIEKRFCGTQFDLKVKSILNRMIVTVKTSQETAFLDCLVQAVTGPDFDQYKNIVSTEIDSSEFGAKKGTKETTCPCGWSNKATFQNLARIVSGKKAGRHEFPWMAGVRKDGMQFCGASIITEYHVLTAAHCTVNKHNISLEVLVGTNIRWAELEGQRIKVKQIVEHKYNRTNGHENDIAILVLEEKINFNDNVGPVCLTPEFLSDRNEYLTVMGWGTTKQFKSQHPDYLRKANVRVVDINTCSYKFRRKFITKNSSRICTWSSDKDSCMGDSGGPLVWLDPETNRYVQVALVSFGKGCRTPNPKVNTAVSYFYEWIKQVVGDTESDAKICTKI
ncbi:venom serine protease-like isoform X3 [Rhodnius prolixus]|uniref:venom serine protease-like isoform X3 n=1 Tax=Rhodnius prolixus TaxID=13249 RepID=UPI003D18F812